MMKNIAPLTLISRTSFSESSLSVSALEDSCTMKGKTVHSKYRKRERGKKKHCDGKPNLDRTYKRENKVNIDFFRLMQ